MALTAAINLSSKKTLDQEAYGSHSCGKERKVTQGKICEASAMDVMTIFLLGAKVAIYYSNKTYEVFPRRHARSVSKQDLNSGKMNLVDS